MLTMDKFFTPYKPYSPFTRNTNEIALHNVRCHTNTENKGTEELDKLLDADNEITKEVIENVFLNMIDKGVLSPNRALNWYYGFVLCLTGKKELTAEEANKAVDLFSKKLNITELEHENKKCDILTVINEGVNGLAAQVKDHSLSHTDALQTFQHLLSLLKNTGQITVEDQANYIFKLSYELGKITETK